MVSIHASAREATRARQIIDFISGVSIHASAREATPFRQQVADLMSVSIHASAREATIKDVTDRLTFCSFNPRLREGGDSIDY